MTGLGSVSGQSVDFYRERVVLRVMNGYDALKELGVYERKGIVVTVREKFNELLEKRTEGDLGENDSEGYLSLPFHHLSKTEKVDINLSGQGIFGLGVREKIDDISLDGQWPKCKEISGINASVARTNIKGVYLITLVGERGTAMALRFVSDDRIKEFENNPDDLKE